MSVRVVEKRREHKSKNDDNDEKDIFKILIATDCHLGYEERGLDKAQKQDSFVTFEEILKLASTENVDFILLGGDLFHDSKPSQNVVLRCINLLRKYCLGTRFINYELLTEPSEVLSSEVLKVNYEDENLNVSMPVFTIHGNHDNPSFEHTSTLDILVASGLVNYFGKLTELDEITVVPMIFKKGRTYIAIYGISYIGEQRLSRLFKQNRVKFLKPKNIDNCFNILVLHQNRAKHTAGAHIGDDKLPGFFDLVFWGHEHECRITPEYRQNGEDSYRVTQPGSSVATSLCEGEAVPKHVGILKIQGEDFCINEKKLQTVRPFVFDTISLPKIVNENYCLPTADGIFEYVDDYIENTIFPRVKKLLTGHPQQPTLPLIRLRLTFNEAWQKFDDMKITRKYCDRVANPKSIILYRKEVAGKTKGDSIDDEDGAEALAECFSHNDSEQDWSFFVQNGIQKYFEQSDTKLRVLSLLGLNEALNRCVDTNDDMAFTHVVNHQIQKTLDFFKGRRIELTEPRFREELQAFVRHRAAKSAEDQRAEIGRILNNVQAKSRDDRAVVNVDSDDEVMATKPTRGRGRGSRGATTRGTTRGRGRAAKNALDISVSSTKNRKTDDWIRDSESDISIRAADMRSRFTQRSSQLPASRLNNTSTHNASQFHQVSDSDSD